MNCIWVSLQKINFHFWIGRLNAKLLLFSRSHSGPVSNVFLTWQRKTTFWTHFWTDLFLTEDLQTSLNESLQTVTFCCWMGQKGNPTVIGTQETSLTERQLYAAVRRNADTTKKAKLPHLGFPLKASNAEIWRKKNQENRTQNPLFPWVAYKLPIQPLKFNFVMV